MAQNDIVLIDSLIERNRAHYGARLDLGEVFELFSFDHILKDYDLTYEELTDGWVDGPDDGGVDGFFTFLDGQCLTEVPDNRLVRRSPHFEVVVVTAKAGTAFKQVPINNLLSSVLELFDLQKEPLELTYPFEATLVESRELFRKAYIELAVKNPTLSIRLNYACRANTHDISPNVTARADQIVAHVRNLFSAVDVSFNFVGAAELLVLARRERTYALRLSFIESFISRAKSNYLVLTRIPDYLAFITDDMGNLRRYLFEANVRDYLGDVSVNRDILSSLMAGPKDAADFWWLNNGITLLASDATVAGKEISLENVQIVNGLQTTESIYRYSRSTDIAGDERALLVKILITDDDEIRDRIVKATNYQNGVEIASLRATDAVQRNIEHYLGDRGWYYDRRKNFYRNQGKAGDRIVSMSYLGAAVRALVLKLPDAALRQNAKWMRDDANYARIFDEQRDLRVYLVCLETCRLVDDLIRSYEPPSNAVKRSHLRRLRFVVALMCVVKRLGNPRYDVDDLSALAETPITSDEVFAVFTDIAQAGAEFLKLHPDRKRWGRPSPDFIAFAVDRLGHGPIGHVPNRQAELADSGASLLTPVDQAGIGAAAADPEASERRLQRQRKWWKLW